MYTAVLDRPPVWSCWWRGKRKVVAAAAAERVGMALPACGAGGSAQAACLDHLLFLEGQQGQGQGQRLRVGAVLAEPELQEVEARTGGEGLPSALFPSDHILLAARLRLLLG